MVSRKLRTLKTRSKDFEQELTHIDAIKSKIMQKNHT